MKKQVLTMALLVIMAIGAAAAAEDIAVIVHAGNPAKLGSNEVKDLFLKKKKWSTGEKSRSVDRSGNPSERQIFCKKVLGMEPTAVDKYWLEQQYAAGLSPPPRVGGDSAVIEFVGSFETGLGYVKASSVTEEAKTKIKVVLTVAQ